MPKTFVGSRVRQLRSERGFSQAALAQLLEISPSYLNQIEHDVRPLTVAVLLRITELFGVDATFFASRDDTRLVAELREVMYDRDLGPTGPGQLLRRGDGVAVPAVPRCQRELRLRHRAAVGLLPGELRDRLSSALHHAAAVHAWRTVLLRAG